MPSSLMLAESSFPSFTGNETLTEKVDTTLNYVYMLVEQLRYTLNNLGVSNFNETELDSITSPILAKITDDEENIAKLYLTADQMMLQLSDAENNISTLTQTSELLSSRITDNDEDISQLTQTATSLTSRISTAEGNISTLTQTATSLQSQITNANGEISTLQQTATSLTSQVSNNESAISTLTQTVNGFTLSVTNNESTSTIKLMSNGTVISSDKINMTGLVTFTDLETAGSTTINGSNITTGTIDAQYIDASTIEVSDLYGTTVYLRDYAGTERGSITIEAGSTARYKISLAADGGLDLRAGTGAAFLGAGTAYVQVNNSESVQVGAGTIPLRPASNNTQTLGTSSYKWSVVYAGTGTINTSDRNEKTEIDYDMSRYEALFDALQPCSFRFTDRVRTHWGMISQDVEDSMTALGFTGTDIAAFCKDESDTAAGGYVYGLRYSEFIPLLIAQVQALKARVKILEGNT